MTPIINCIPFKVSPEENGFLPRKFLKCSKTHSEEQQVLFVFISQCAHAREAGHSIAMCPQPNALSISIKERDYCTIQSNTPINTVRIGLLGRLFWEVVLLGEHGS